MANNEESTIFDKEFLYNSLDINEQDLVVRETTIESVENVSKLGRDN